MSRLWRRGMTWSWLNRKPERKDGLPWMPPVSMQLIIFWHPKHSKMKLLCSNQEKAESSVYNWFIVWWRDGAGRLIWRAITDHIHSGKPGDTIRWLYVELICQHWWHASITVPNGKHWNIYVSSPENSRRFIRMRFDMGLRQMLQDGRSQVDAYVSMGEINIWEIVIIQPEMPSYLPNMAIKKGKQERWMSRILPFS